MKPSKSIFEAETSWEDHQQEISTEVGSTSISRPKTSLYQEGTDNPLYKEGTDNQIQASPKYLEKKPKPIRFKAKLIEND